MEHIVCKAQCLAKLLVVLAALSCSAFGQDCSQSASDFRLSVVSLSVEKTKKGTGAVTSGNGTGFIVTTEGHVVTAYHVVAEDADTDEVRVYGAIGSLFGAKVPLQILTGDKVKDVAILVFSDNSQAYRPIPLGNPFKVLTGGQLCSLSFSAPISEDFHPTTGTLSAKTGEDKKTGVKNLWTTQMPSNFGESGAPVVDLAKGGVVAIKYGGRDPATVQNVNYLIPINMAKTMLEEYCDLRIPTTSPPSSTVTVAEARLESIRVSFVMPPGDGKDFDTKVGISIMKGTTLIASEEDIAPKIEFTQGVNYGPFNVPVGSAQISQSMYKNSAVILSITPVGHDRWITGLAIEAKFSDGQVIRSQFGPIIVDQDVKTAQFQNP